MSLKRKILPNYHCSTSKIHKSTPLPTGLYLYTNLINSTTQQNLVNFIDEQKWDDQTLKRRVQHYGYIYPYDKFKSIKSGFELSETTPIPNLFLELIQSIIDQNNHIKELIHDSNSFFDQVIVNEYKPGQGIAPHIDNTQVFGSVILCVSLLSEYVMEFTHEQTNVKQCIPLPVGSVLVLTDDARYVFKHGIATRKQDTLQNGQKSKRARRISITFRKLLRT